MRTGQGFCSVKALGQDTATGASRALMRRFAQRRGLESWISWTPAIHGRSSAAHGAPKAASGQSRRQDRRAGVISVMMRPHVMKTALFHGRSRSERGRARIERQGFLAIRSSLRPVNSGSKRGFEKRIERSSKKGLQGFGVGRKYAFTSGAEAELGGRTV